jgi:uncharacterized membrane protein
MPATDQNQTSTPAVAFVERLERNEGLDRPAAVFEKLARAVSRPGAVEDALLGTWMGHALHPLMTDLPIGFWTSASVLDLLGGRSARPAAQKLLGLGVLSAIPTAATGLAEWLHADAASRRVGVVHANANTVGLVLYIASYRARRRGKWGRGVVLAAAGATLASAGGYLGGHLSAARKVGTRDPALATDAGIGATGADDARATGGVAGAVRFAGTASGGRLRGVGGATESAGSAGSPGSGRSGSTGDGYEVDQARADGARTGAALPGAGGHSAGRQTGNALPGAGTDPSA